MDADTKSEDHRGSAVRTFLFVDIRGYTQFIVEHGDSEGARMVRKFHEVAQESITPHRGEIIGKAGDETVAVFDSARDALRAAVGLQAKMAEVSQADPSMPIQVGVGLDSGEAIRSGDTYVGAALNLAARLCKLAGPEEVLASEGLVHVAGKLDGVSYVERGLSQLKGFREPVRVYRVARDEGRARPAAPGSWAAEEAASAETSLPIGGFLGALPSTELVARERELAHAMTAADAVAAGSGRLLVLTGEPGVGKTRLAQEIMLTTRNRRFLVAAGRCYEPQESVPFYPFLDALAAVYAGAPTGIRSQVPSEWPYLCRLLPEIHIDAGPTTASTPEEKQRLFREVTGFLQAIAAQVPMAILLDDLHWADGASLELLQHLARHTRGDRILLVGTYRNVDVGRHHPLEAALRDLSREDLVERISMPRLEATGTAQLIASALGEPSVSAELGAVVHEHTDGNPFFTQQLVRFLVERGDLVRQGGRWVERSHRHAGVPESVRSVIGQRMERLGGATQEVLREAAVLGQVFAFDALMHLTGRPESEVEAAMEEALHSGLVEDRQHDKYAFDHALTQQALYDELPVRKRRRLHEAAAESLERLSEPERTDRSAELAWHFLEAAQEARAVPFALAAGDRAQSVFANREAERQYSTVLEIAEHARNVPWEVEALRRRAHLYGETWKGSDAERDYERLLRIAGATGDRHLELVARLGLARALYVLSLDETERDVISRCRTMSESAYSLASELGNSRAKIEALLGTVNFADFWPDYREKIERNVAEALALSRDLGDEQLILRCELENVWNEPRQQAEASLDRLQRRLNELHDLHRLNHLYFGLMWTNLHWAEYVRAVEICDAGIRIAGQIGVPPVQYPTLKAIAQIRLGRYGDAWASLQREVTDADHPFGRAMQAFGLAIYYLEIEDTARAEETARDLLLRAKQLRRAWMTAAGCSLLGRSLLRAGKLNVAGRKEIEDRLREIRSEIPALLRLQLLIADGHAEDAVHAAREEASKARASESIDDLLELEEVETRALLEVARFREAADVAEAAIQRAGERRATPMAWRLLALRAWALSRLGDEAGAHQARSDAGAKAKIVGGSIPDAEMRERFFASERVAPLLRGTR